MRILVVEDDALLGDGIQAGLKQQGFGVDWVRDGVAAQLDCVERDGESTELTLRVPSGNGDAT